MSSITSPSVSSTTSPCATVSRSQAQSHPTVPMHARVNHVGSNVQTHPKLDAILPVLLQRVPFTASTHLQPAACIVYVRGCFILISSCINLYLTATTSIHHSVILHIVSIEEMLCHPCKAHYQSGQNSFRACHGCHAGVPTQKQNPQHKSHASGQNKPIHAGHRGQACIVLRAAEERTKAWQTHGHWMA